MYPNLAKLSSNDHQLGYVKKIGKKNVAVPVLVLWVGLEKSKELNLNVKNIFAMSHTQHHHWRCFKHD
jgi:hypothetical protein